VIAGIIPLAVLETELFAVFAAFVAINTVIYTALAVAKILPKIYLTDLFSRRNSRSETRSIHPDGLIGGKARYRSNAEPD
jgi:hypothetical protein